MTAVEMQRSFLLKAQQLDSNMRNIDSYDISNLLTEAQNVYVDRYAPLYETSTNAKERLDVLVKNISPSIQANITANIPNGQFVNIPTDVRYPLVEWAVGSTGVLKVVPLKYDLWLIEKDNPFKKPSSDLVWRVNLGVKHELITDGNVALATYHLRYISNPVAIDIEEDIDCVLPEKDHQEIVNIALTLLAPKQTQKNA